MKIHCTAQSCSKIVTMVKYLQANVFFSGGKLGGGGDSWMLSFSTVIKNKYFGFWQQQKLH